MNNLTEDFRKKICEYHMIESGTAVIAGVSGGADSVCLLTLLHELWKDAASGSPGAAPFTLEAVHVHHGIRGKSADEDALFVENLCKNLGVPLRIFYEDIPGIAAERKQTEEEAGRIRRYDDLREALGGRNGVIAVAHNADDQAETVLFHLMRGSSLKGISGMRPVSGDIIRPLLFFTRTDIEAFLEERKIAYRTDETNLTDDHTRNRIRHHILSYAKREISPKATENICRAAEMIFEAEEYLEREVSEKAAFKTLPDGTLSALIPDADPVLQKKLIYRAISEAAGRKKDIRSIHVEAVYELLSKKGGGFADLPYLLRAKVRNGMLFISRKTNAAGMEKEPGREIGEAGAADPNAGTPIPEGAVSQRILTEFDRDKIPRSLYTKWFDYDKIINALCVRTRQAGDYLIIDDKGNKKTLKKYLIDEKIPREERDLPVLVADGSHILWVIGHRISEYYKVSETTKRVLEITADKEMLYGGKD